MSISIGRAARVLLGTACAVTAAAVAVPAAAAPAPVVGARELAAASSAVSTSGVDGIAWYVDSASKRVVVTADSTV